MLLPRPAFNANAVRINGATADDFVAIERLSARLAFFPLLRGEFAFRELVLQRPEAHFTRDRSGRIEFLSLMAQPDAARPSRSEPGASVAFDWDVERVLIEEGAARLVDASGASLLALQGIDITVAAARAAPVTIAGDVILAGIPITLNASVGRGGSSGVHTISLAAKLAEADAAAKFSGTVSPARDWEMRGDLSVTSSSAAALFAALGVVGPAVPVPQATHGPLSLTAKLRGNAATLSADPLTLDLGGTPAKGVLTWRAPERRPETGEIAAPGSLDVNIEVGTVQLETWRLAGALGGPPFSVDGSPPFAVVGRARAQTAGPGGVANAWSGALKNLDAKFDIRLPVLSYRGQTLHGGAVTASMSAGVLTISDAGVELPAATRAKVYGLVRLEDAPVMEGAVEIQTGDLRGLLAWLGVDLDPERNLPGRLSNASFRAALQGTPAQVTLGDVAATFDTSAVTGRISWRSAQPVPSSQSSSTMTSGRRSALGIDLIVNALNLDVYLPLFTERKAAAGAGSSVGDPAKPGAYGVTPAFAAFAGLADFDADLRLQIDALTAGGVANGKVGLDLALKDAVLNVRTASFENVGGATAWFSGAIGGFGVTPRFDDVQFDASTTDLARVGRAFGFDVPPPLRSLTPISLTGFVKGSFAQADLTATLKLADLVVRADAQALALDQQTQVTMNIEASQPSYAKFIAAAGAAWPLNLPDPGAVKMVARVVHENSATRVESFDLRIGNNAVTGTLNIARTGPHPEITGTLNAIALAGDRLWPRVAAVRPVSPEPRRPSTRAAAIVPPWSADQFDWRFLSGWRGDIQVSGPSFSFRGFQVQDFAGRIVVADDAVELVDWRGKVFGVPGQLYLRAVAVPEPTIQGEIAFLGGDLAAVAAAVNGGTGNLAPGGTADFAGSFRAKGMSAAAMAAGLSGAGTIKIVTSDAGSGVISGLLGAVAAARQLEGLTSGGQATGPVTLESRMSAAEGRIRIEDATVASKSYGGAITGTIDLPRWQVDLAGKLRLESRASGTAARPQVVPVTIKGALDLPNIMLLPSTP